MKIKDDKFSPLIPNIAIGLVGMHEMSRLRKASRRPRRAQANTLRAILTAAKDSRFGVEHHFDEIISCRSNTKMINLYRRYVKPCEFEDMRPYVKHMLEGESNVLFAGKPSLYATTSGSTGEPKYVPISEKYAHDVYGRMTRIWLYNFIKHKKNCFSGCTLAIVGKQVEGHTLDGTPIGSVSGAIQKDAPNLIKKRYATPTVLFDIDDYTARNYAIMRFALERNVTVFGSPNPSTIVELQNTVDQHLDEIIEDIGHGTLSERYDIAPQIRDAVAPLLKPNPERAYELRALQSKYEQVQYRHFWPNLQILSTWKCGNTQIYLKRFAGTIPSSCFHQEVGYFATECRFGLVLDDTNESVMMPHMHFYEFKREKDLSDPDAKFYQLHELKEGERYCPFITTYSGLYRYNMNDIIQVSDSIYKTPRVHMVQKVNGIVSITGEKLYEDQFIKSVDQAQEQTGLKLSYYTGYVNLSESRYDWYFEFNDKRVGQKKAEAFAKVVDENLMRINIEYESKRKSFRLKDPAVYLLEANTFDKFKEYILNKSHRDASRFKPNVLAQNETNHAIIHRFRKK